MIMNKCFLILLILLAGSLLFAESYDEVLDKLFATGGFDNIDGKQVWAAKGPLVSENEAYEYVAWSSMIFFYTWVQASEPSNSSHKRQINSIQEVVGFWYDEYDDITYMIAIPRQEIVNKFNDDKYSEFSPDELYEEFLKYVNYYGDVSAYE